MAGSENQVWLGLGFTVRAVHALNSVAIGYPLRAPHGFRVWGYRVSGLGLRVEKG